MVGVLTANVGVLSLFINRAQAVKIRSKLTFSLIIEVALVELKFGIRYEGLV